MAKPKDYIAKKILAQRLYERLDKQIELKTVTDVITYISVWITEQVLAEHQATIKNFITFSIKLINRPGLTGKLEKFYNPKVYVQPLLKKTMQAYYKQQKEISKL